LVVLSKVSSDGNVRESNEYGSVHKECYEHVTEGKVLQECQTDSVYSDRSAFGGGPQYEPVT
jgi:hypothetical protein